MSEKNILQVSERRQLKLCLLSLIVVWALSSVLSFGTVEETYRVLIVFGFVGFLEALFLAPLLLSFYLIHQKKSFQRTGLLGVMNRILLGGALGVLSAILQVFFNLRDASLLEGILFVGLQGVTLGALYSAFQSMKVFLDLIEIGKMRNT